MKYWLSQLQAASEAHRAQHQARRDEKASRPWKIGWRGCWRRSPSRYSGRGCRCRLFKLHCAADRAATVIPVSLEPRYVGRGFSGGATGGALEGSMRCGAGLHNATRGCPLFSHERRFSMSEFEAALKTQGRYISPVLLELGWRRKRVWSTTGQYHRYWEPPANSD